MLIANKSEGLQMVRRAYTNTQIAEYNMIDLLDFMPYPITSVNFFARFDTKMRTGEFPIRRVN